MVLPASMKTLSNIIEKYAAFEAEVCSYSKKIYQDHCAACKGVCCKPEYCEESLTSPFLSRIRQNFVPGAVYASKRGWLTEKGCALPVGRPPVCYQFLCDTILTMRPDAEFRYAIMVLSNLVGHIGKRALGGRHIVELENVSELGRINLTAFENQLGEAEDAFGHVRAYLDGSITKLDSLPILKKISAAPADLA